MIKKETGKSSHEYIQAKNIYLAKDKIFDRNESVNEVVYKLGFKFPRDFSLLLKLRVGSIPTEYRC